MPSEYGLPFTGAMVRATIQRRKNQTRRVIVPRVGGLGGLNFLGWEGNKACFVGNKTGIVQRVRCPYGMAGDRLWVREKLVPTILNDLICYAEGNGAVLKDGTWAPWTWKVRTIPSIYMPRWASRILLVNEGVDVQKVTDISDADALAEGVTLPERTSTLYNGIYRDAFHALWDSINLDRGYGWSVDPWVFRVKYRVLEVLGE